MLDRLEAMSMLLRVVDRDGFSAASRNRGVPLATVSRKVNEFEKRLGTRLLVRTTRRVALTDAGARYVASARRILDEIDESERIAAGEFDPPRGELLLTAPVAFGRLHVLPIITKFLATFPDIIVRLLFSDRNQRLVPPVDGCRYPLDISRQTFTARSRRPSAGLEGAERRNRRRHAA